MSGDTVTVCTSPQSSSQKQFTSRIPVVSPNPLRRSFSLRERKSSDSFLSSYEHSAVIIDSSTTKQQNHSHHHHHQHHHHPFVSNSNGTDVNRNSIYWNDLENGHLEKRVDRTLPGKTASRQSSSASVALRRGTSFIERGEKVSRRSFGGSYGRVRAASSVASTTPSAAVTTESRPTGGPSGPPNRETSTPHQSPRTRSMSLSISKTQSSTPVSVRSPAADIVSSPRTPPSSPEARHRNLRDWDADSVTSSISNISLASCEHATVARNGTTFSGRSMKYVVHCSEHSGAGEDYLTPTQRAHRQVKRLKMLLQQAQKELEQKDSEILKLTKEVVELRLYKAALNSPEDRSTSSDAVTVKENTSEQVTPIADHLENGPVVEMGGGGGLQLANDLSSSCADSGHFEDFTNSSVHSKDSICGSEEPLSSNRKLFPRGETAEKSVLANLGPRDVESEHNRLIVEYERRIQELVRTHEEDCHQMKQKHNDKVEELLQRLSEINARYWELVPDLEAARERIKELEQQLEDACKKLEEQEQKHKEGYLKMYAQEQEAAKTEQDKQVTELALKKPSRLSVPELLHQLQVTQQELENVKDLEFASSSKQPLLSAKEAVALWVLGARKAMYKQLLQAKSCASKIDPEVTLQFLKSAIYYFLTDKENNQGHLRAIQSILGFTESEISSIDKARHS
ncbi:uncharacterized protein LOC108738852 isoform X2 [Agrilus planipennis]|uniref:Uncharacterized protein LOC108738852 isoform X2 n=1 Tax=Agrilus planipennis TaxID=224129 RepID=A0A1W4X6K0_AGRPL|nr:uncharacterized protein LOC108738852 isoform X2 [Agrilus planipennis]